MECRSKPLVTNLGEVVSGGQMTALPLNGRSYTDLLAIQPGVAPISTLLPSSVIMAGVTGSIDPSGDLNPGNLSINGQRESANGFLVNGIDVQEHMNGGTSIIPDLDSIEQFRVLTANFDPEYGNYDGGIVTVISKSGTSQFHGRAFEFFRNTELDAKGYFDPTRSAFDQNQFGGAIGGPIKQEKLFFFTDYQGTRTTQGVSTGKISVPTVAAAQRQFSRSHHAVEHAHGKRKRSLSGISADAGTWLYRHCGRSILRCLSEWGYPPKRMVRTRKKSAAIHPISQYRFESVFDLSVLADSSR